VARGMAYRGLHALSQPAYLEDFINSVSNLPQELRDKYGRMGELDALVQRLKNEADALVRELLRKPGSSDPDRGRDTTSLQQMGTKLEQLQAQCVKLNQEKLQLAETAYNTVDQHVRDLDTKLREYEAYLRREGQWPDDLQSLVVNTDHTKMASMKNAAAAAAHTAAAPATTARSTQKAPSKGQRKSGEPSTLHIMDDMPIDPNEPRYCYCQNVSYGQMVACESGDCPYEWFHFECVGLTEPPKGEWICPDCRARTGRVR
jgi:myosin heavy subunit